MTKSRAFPFFPEHWKGDVALNMCSMAAQGLWMRMLCEMHSAVPYGHLVTPTGLAIEVPRELALLVRQKPADVARWIAELEHAGVFSRSADGVIYSRRMTRDRATRDNWRDRQNRKRGGDVTQMSRVTNDPCHANVTPDVTQMSLSNNGNNGNNGKYLSPDGERARPPVLSPKSHAPWIASLEADLAAIRELELQALTGTQRAILGRYHAMQFGRTVDEAANTRKGAQLAGTFGKMAASPEFGDLLVDEYLILAEKFFELQGAAPWFRPWDIKGVAPPELLARGNGAAR